MKIKVVAQDVHLWEIDPKKLTTDCYTVIHKDGTVDVVRGRMVGIFDQYHDAGIKLQKIQHSGGTRNPKFQEPEW